MAISKDEIGKEESKRRRALNRAFALALKNRAKGSGWRVSQGVLFQDVDGWFVSAPAAVWVGRRKSQIELHCKPMGLDPIFWEIVEAESNSSMPLSFRYHGAWTCGTPALVEHELDEETGDPGAIAAEAVAWLDAQVGQFKTWTTRYFLQLLQQHPRINSYLATAVTTMCLIGDYLIADSLCKDAIKRGDACGFSLVRASGPSQSFPELALKWLYRKRASFH